MCRQALYSAHCRAGAWHDAGAALCCARCIPPASTRNAIIAAPENLVQNIMGLDLYRQSTDTQVLKNKRSNIGTPSEPPLLRPTHCDHVPLISFSVNRLLSQVMSPDTHVRGPDELCGLLLAWPGFSVQKHKRSRSFTIWCLRAVLCHVQQ
jgi:hypothetical protein